MARDYSNAEVLYRVVIKYRYTSMIGTPDAHEKIGRVTYGPYPDLGTAKGVGTNKARWYKASGRLVGEPEVQFCTPEWNKV